MDASAIREITVNGNIIKAIKLIRDGYIMADRSLRLVPDVTDPSTMRVVCDRPTLKDSKDLTEAIMVMGVNKFLKDPAAFLANYGHLGSMKAGEEAK